MYNKYLGSSVNPNKLSLTIKGALIALVPIIVAILKASGVDITEISLIDLINSIFTAVSALLVVYGLGRKIFYKVKK